MENRYQVTIAYRTTQGMQLTPQGEYLSSQGIKLLKEFETLKSHLWNMDAEHTGTLKLGVANFMTRYRLPDILQDFKSIYPKVNFQVTSGWSKDMLDLAYTNEVHISFIRGDYAWQGQKELLFEEPLCVISAEPLQLSQLPFLSRIDYNTDAKLRDLIDQWWFENFETPPFITMNVNQTDTSNEMVKQGLGYSIVPRMVVENTDGLYVHNLRDSHHNYITRPSWMIYKEEHMNLKIVRAFVNYAKKAME